MNLAIVPRHSFHEYARPQPTRMQRIAFWFSLTNLAVTLIGLAALHTDVGRRKLADLLEHLVSNAIPGTMTIGNIESLGWLEPVLVDVRFAQPDGTLTLLAKRATIELDVAAVLRGQLAFHRARVEGGYLLIALQPNGRTGLEATFDNGIARLPDQRDDHLQLQLSNLFVEDVTAVFVPSEGHTFRMRNVQGFVGISHLDTPGVRVRLDRITGELETPEVLGAQLTVAHADGWVHANEVHVLDLNLETQLGSGYLDGHLAYYDRDTTPVELELEPKAGIEPYVASIAAEAQSWFRDTLAVNIR